MVIVFLGPPGVGKGTQCRLLAASSGLPHVSTGELFRKAVAQASDISQHVAARLSAGQLVDDRLVFDVVEWRLGQSDCRKGCILDGFPRNLSQAEWLDQWLAQRGRNVDLVIALNAAESELVDRLLRRASQEHRSDDTLETVRTRLALYRSHTEPLVDYYRRRGVLVEVDGLGTPEEVARRIRQAMDQRIGGTGPGDNREG
ncbi:MAG: adenylate kinase [Pirellulaceae bacterium]|nr:MAG: adenylate kinase [Pirellulaceae bacterium]